MESGSWMALPLFNRDNSPEPSRNVLSMQKPALLPLTPPAELDETKILGLLDPLHTSDPLHASLDELQPSLELDLGDIYPNNDCLDSLAALPPVDLQPPLDLTAGDINPSNVCSDVFTAPPQLDWTETTNPDQITTDPPQPSDFDALGPGPVTCPYPGCRSTAQFTGAQEFWSHYKQHSKRFFCRHPHCPQAAPDLARCHLPTKRGFSTKKDRARHEARHNPRIQCPCYTERGERCSRMFSRVDNMRDHVRRIHNGRCRRRKEHEPVVEYN